MWLLEKFKVTYVTHLLLLLDSAGPDSQEALLCVESNLAFSILLLILPLEAISNTRAHDSPVSEDTLPAPSSLPSQIAFLLGHVKDYLSKA